MLMGALGVGQIDPAQTALAGGTIATGVVKAPSSTTTRARVVVLSRWSSVRPASTRPAALPAHPRRPPSLEQKISSIRPTRQAPTDQPRNARSACLTVADVVLYVGSQRSDHDQIICEGRSWRSASGGSFAFVVNKVGRMRPCRAQQGCARRGGNLLRDRQSGLRVAASVPNLRSGSGR